MAETWPVPEGVRVAPDGTWSVGEFRIVHAPSLRFLKERLVFEDEGAFVVQGDRRLPVAVEGPAFEVTELRLVPDSSEARVVLDDGSEEVLGPDSLAADMRTGRVECAARGDRARAVFSRAAHQALLAHVEEVDGRFFLRVGRRLLSIQVAA
ncbi:MAG TPA: hypothetical protein VLL75_11570 [Vicinamibacteria bacterium]|nr:hypothetical protein [Vicinamibacteria bacterium]